MVTHENVDGSLSPPKQSVQTLDPPQNGTAANARPGNLPGPGRYEQDLVPHILPVPVFAQEISAAEVCRPQLFFHHEVAGVIEPATVCTNGGPEGAWLLCTQSSTGKREMRPLSQYLELGS